MSGWQQTALIGIARLTGSAALGATSGALIAAAVPDVLRILFEREDSGRRQRARDLAVHVGGVIEEAVREGVDPGTLEATRFAAAKALADYGLTNNEVVELDLDARRAARAVMEKVTFTADERAEIGPLVEQVLVAFYRGITTSQTTVLGLMPAIQAALLGRSGRQVEALGDLQDEVQERFATAEDAAERRHRELLEVSAREKGVSVPPLLAVLRKLGEAEVAPEDIPARLEAAADRLLAAEARLARPSNDRPEIQAARAKARALINAGDLDGAGVVLRNARTALREQTAREEAALLTDEAAVAEVGLAYREAAELHREAARLLDFDVESAWGAWLRAANALQMLGRDSGDSTILRLAVDWLEHEALPRAPRTDRPLNWAATQNDLGTALAILGARMGKAALHQAAAAFELALEERSRERAPLDWAMTQNNLGNVLLALGECDDDDDALRRAVTAFRAALKECTRERAPPQWAMIKNNLGNALTILGVRTDGTALCGAIKAFNAALLVRTRDHMPLAWAATKNNLGGALLILGRRGNDSALHKAVAAYRVALEERTRERLPFAWAETQTNIGSALRVLGERGDDAALHDAIAAFHKALTVRMRARMPVQWAITQENLALALKVQAQHKRDCGLIEKSLVAINGAIEEYSNRGIPNDLNRARGNRDAILATGRMLGCL